MTHPRDLREGLVISFSYDEQDRVFVLTSDVPFASAPGRRLFAQLRCEAAMAYTRNAADPRWAHCQSAFSCEDALPAFVVHSIIEEEVGDGLHFELDFGPNLGQLGFTCGRFEIRTREAVATQAGSSWDYRDSRTGEAMSFYSPFD